jgi:hypothetical protein
MENLNIRRRSVVRQNYTRTPNALLFGYRGVSDSAKLTYQGIDALDWTDKEGSRKGFAYPTLGRLAELRGATDRTIRRHLGELEQAGLLARQERPGRASLLVLEDPAVPVVRAQTTMPDPEGEPDGRDGDDDFVETPDEFVRPPRTKMSAPYIQQSQKQRSQNNVEQAVMETSRGQRGNDDAHISATLRSRVRELSAGRSAPARQRADFMADELSDALGDQHSRNYFRQLAQTVPVGTLYQALGEVKEAAREGRIKKSRGALFVDCVQRSLTGAAQNSAVIKNPQSKRPPVMREAGG